MSNFRWTLASLLISVGFIMPPIVNGQPWWKKATDGSLDPFNKNNDYGSYINTNNINITPRYETNKFDLKSRVEAGGWHVAWADDIAEKDVAEGAVAAGVSVYSANPGPFLAWVEMLVDRTVSSLQQSGEGIPPSIQNEIRNLAAQVISDAIRGRSAKEINRNFGGIGVKAGAIQYSGSNLLGDRVISKTWGIKPYIAIRITKPQGGVVPPPRVGGGPGPFADAGRFRGGRSGYMFEHVGGSRWLARMPNGNVVADFEEVERSNQFVGLKSHNQFPHIKLFTDHVEEFVPHQSTNWQAVEPGGWIR